MNKTPVFEADQKSAYAKVTDVYKIKPGDVVRLNDFQMSAADADGNITLVDFVMAKEETDTSDYVIRPGAWLVHPKNGMQKLELQEETYFETDTSTELLHHMSRLAAKIDVYKKLNKAPKRGILLGSEPGQGKSSLIRYFCKKVSKESEKTCILKIDSEEMDWTLIQRMFMKKPSHDVDMVVLIAEDIGGADLYHKNHRIDPSLLNFLDGNECFNNYPTLVVATTNYLDELGPTINDRPGRFDVVVQVVAPKDSEIEIIVGSLLDKIEEGRKLTDQERKALFGKGFTPAYCSEIVIRAMLYDITIEESAKQLTEQREKSRKKKHTEPQTSSRFGFSSMVDFD